MTLELNGHDFKYETEQIILLFFPNHENINVKSFATTLNNVYIVESFITANGLSASSTQKGNCKTRLEMANTIKRSLYFASKKLAKAKTPWGILTGIRPAKPIREMLERGDSISEISCRLKNEYLVSEEKLKLGILIAEKELNFISKNINDVSLYIGIPFCPSRCIYCSFISHDAVKMKKLAHLYTTALCKEIKKTGEIVKELGLNVRTIYFGGGTPTALDKESLKLLIDTVAGVFDINTLLEYTVEAGRPDTISTDKLELLKDAGVTRISINPQTVHDKTLEIIGRKHTFSDFLDAFKLAREFGFDNINCDIIAGLPGENEGDFKKSLDTLIGLEPENITIHTLYIKKASFLKTLEISLPTPFEADKMVSYGIKKCIENGYNPYYLYKQKSTIGNLENVGYSRDGFECIYNVDTMSDSCSIIALGAGGISKVVKSNKIERVFNYKNADEYINGFDEIIKRKDEILKLIVG